MAYFNNDPEVRDDSEIIERRLSVLNTLWNDLGGVEIVEVAKSSDYSMEFIAKALKPSGNIEWTRFTVDVKETPPHYLAGFDVRVINDPTINISEHKLSDVELAENASDYINSLVNEDKFSGAILIAKDGIPFFKKAYGLANKRYNIPNQVDTKFNLGSMNKMFTGVAIAQLAQQGKLSFDDPIIKHVPDYPNREIAEKVTIHHLLTHTSGMASYWDELFSSDWVSIRTVEQLIELFADKPLMFEPGEKFYYSNCGPIVLGLIIERITGMSYYDYVAEYIYKPAGMINTGCYEMDRPIENLAFGYTKAIYEEMEADGNWRNNLFMHTVKGGPAGGGYSTVEDLLKFDIALRNNKLLNKKYTDILLTANGEINPEINYAYLFRVENVGEEKIIGHGGGAPGINGKLDMYWNSGYTVAVLANYYKAAEDVANYVKGLLLQ